MCHITCVPNVSDPGCPAGRACGLDHLCRAPSGEFAVDPIRIDLADARALAVGDVDGDFRDDVVAQLDGPDLELVHVFPSVEVLHLGDIAGISAVGDLDGDDADEVLVGLAPPDEDATSATVGLALFRQDEPHRPFEVVLATLRTADASARLLSVTPARDRMLEIVSPTITRAWSSTAQDAVAVTPTIAVDATSLGTAVAVADLDGADTCAAASGDFPRREVALAVTGASAVPIVSSCGGVLPFELAALGEVALPASAALGAAGSFFADANGDAALDLFVQAEDGAVLVAYGVGDGTFHSAPAVPAMQGDGAFASFWGEDDGVLLAVADFDGDAQVELVTTASYVAAPEDCTAACTRAWPVPFATGVAADVNGDGALDVVGSHDDTLAVHLVDRDADGVDFLVSEVELRGPARTLVVGDFDRDTIDDVAFLEQDAGADMPADEHATVLYGGPDRELERFGPFVTAQTLAVEHDDTLVVRTIDAQERPAGAFIRPDRTGHDFGFVVRAPVLVRTAAGLAAVSVALVPDQEDERIVHLGVAAGTISPHDVVVGPPLPGLVAGTGATSIAAAVDLDRSGHDELVVLGTTSAGGAVWIAELDPATGAWTMREPFVVAAVFAGAPSSDEASAAPGSALAIGDVDHDGDDDVVVTTADPAFPRVLVLRNDDGALSADATVVLANPLQPGFELALVVPWHVGVDGLQRWLVAGADGVAVADIDLDAREILVRTRFGPIAQALATGDVDGDGLLDAIVGARGEMRIYLAQETLGDG